MCHLLSAQGEDRFQSLILTSYFYSNSNEEIQRCLHTTFNVSHQRSAVNFLVTRGVARDLICGENKSDSVLFFQRSKMKIYICQKIYARTSQLSPGYVFACNISLSADLNILAQTIFSTPFTFLEMGKIFIFQLLQEIIVLYNK